MHCPAILSLATSVPEHQHQQLELHDRWLFSLIGSHRARAIFAASDIATRYSIFSDATFLHDEPTTESRNNLYLETGQRLARPLIERVLTQADLHPSEIDHFILISCTGLDSPGLEVKLASELGMSPTLRRTALIGMGCHAGLTGLDRAMLELAARPDSRVLVVAVELCMLHFQPGGKMANMIAGAIFADGLGAAVIGSRPADVSNRLPRLIDTMTYHDYTSQQAMGVHVTDKGFQIELSTKVPKILRQLIGQVVAEFLQQVKLTQDQIRFWGIHPGGAKIIEYVGQTLNLSPADLEPARRVLRQYGNMSSATIFFVLEEICHHGQPQPGDYGILMTFGPGLTVELCLIQW